MWFSILKNEPKPHHDGRVYADPKKLGRPLRKKEIENNGEILLLDAIEGASYAKKLGNTVILEPQWLNSYQPRSGDFGSGWYRGDKVFGFIFNFEDIHDRKMCVKHVYSRQLPKIEFDEMLGRSSVSVYRKTKNRLVRETCLRMKSQMDGSNADVFVSLVMAAKNKDLFLSLWGKERANFGGDDDEATMLRNLRAEKELMNVKYKRNKDGTVTRIEKKEAMGWTDWNNMDSKKKTEYLKRNPDVFLDSNYYGGVTPYYNDEETV